MDSAKSSPGNGLQTVADVILAPKTAFERLRTLPTWGWAFVISLVVYTIASYLIVPALLHATQASWPQMVASNPTIQQLTPEQQQHGLAVTLAIVRFAWLGAIVEVPLAILVMSVVMLIFNAIGHGSTNFARLWAAAANISVPAGALGGIVLAVIVILRGADSFSSPTAVMASLPSLAWIIPSASVKAMAFLGNINIFQLWGAVLVYIALRVTARVSTVPAVLAAIVLPLFWALLAMAGAR